MRRLFVAVTFLFCFVMPSRAEEPVRIGVTLGLTGKYAEMADRQMKGYRLWEREVNNNGGILGRKVTLVIYDDKSDPRTAKDLYEHLITKDKVDILFSPYGSDITEAVLPVTEKHLFPVLISGAAADRLWEKGYKYIFGLYTPASKYTIGFLELLAKNDVESVAIVHGEDSFSKDVATGAEKWAGRFGLTVRLFEGLRTGAQAPDELARKIMTSRAQALMVCGHVNEAVEMRLALKRIAWHPKAFFATVGPLTQTFLQRLGPDVNLVFSSSQWEHHGGTNPAGWYGSPHFYESYVKAYREEPSYHSATAYAAGHILKTALTKAGTLDREKLRSALYKMDSTSILGRFGVDGRGMQIRHFNLIIQWQNGKKEIVWPEELRTAKPLLK